MDIQALSMDLSQQQLRDQAGTAVMKIAMNTSKTQAEGLEKLMSSAVLPPVKDPALGANIDILA